MVAGFAEIMESEEILIAGARDHPEFASLAVPHHFDNQWLIDRNYPPAGRGRS
jgi:hypothetical protein